MKILGAILELPAKQHYQSNLLPQNWAKLAKSAVQFSWYLQNGSQDFDFFSIAMGVDYSFYVKSIATYALTFFGCIISVLASVFSKFPQIEWIVQEFRWNCYQFLEELQMYKTDDCWFLL